MARVQARLVWLLIVGAVLNGLGGLCAGALWLSGLIDASWTVVLSPVWVPLAIAGALAIVLLVQSIGDGLFPAWKGLADSSAVSEPF